MGYFWYIRDIEVTLEAVTDNPDIWDGYRLKEEYDEKLRLHMNYLEPDVVTYDEGKVDLLWQMYAPFENEDELSDAVKRLVEVFKRELGVELSPEYKITSCLFENSMTYDEYYYYKYLVEKKIISPVHSYIYDGRHLTWDAVGDDLGYGHVPEEAVQYADTLKHMYEGLGNRPQEKIRFNLFVINQISSWLGGLEVYGENATIPHYGKTLVEKTQEIISLDQRIKEGKE